MIDGKVLVTLIEENGADPDNKVVILLDCPTEQAEPPEPYHEFDDSPTPCGDDSYQTNTQQDRGGASKKGGKVGWRRG
jgi:hypothetical protein